MRNGRDALVASAHTIGNSVRHGKAAHPATFVHVRHYTESLPDRPAPPPAISGLVHCYTRNTTLRPGSGRVLQCCEFDSVRVSRMNPKSPSTRNTRQLVHCYTRNTTPRPASGRVLQCCEFDSVRVSRIRVLSPNRSHLCRMLCDAKSFYPAFTNKDSHPSLVQSMFYASSVLDEVMFKHASGFRIGNRSAKMPHV